MHDRALAEPEAAARHRQPLLKDMISHDDLGPGGGPAVEMQGAGAGHELRPIVAERARRLVAHTRARHGGQEQALDVFELLNHAAKSVEPLCSQLGIISQIGPKGY